jgi:hypothetical protein
MDRSAGKLIYGGEAWQINNEGIMAMLIRNEFDCKSH